MLSETLMFERENVLAFSDYLGPDPTSRTRADMSLASYVANDPVNLTDPLGLAAVELDGVKCDGYDVNIATMKDGKVTCSGYNYGAGISGGAALLGGGGGVGPPSGGGSFGGGGASGTWGDSEGEAMAIGEEIVVTGARVIRRAAPTPPPPNRIYFGYPPEQNSTWHITRHLVRLSPGQRRSLRAAVGRQVRSMYPFIPSGEPRTGFTVFDGREYQWRAFGLPNGITNIGTIFDVTE